MQFQRILDAMLLHDTGERVMTGESAESPGSARQTGQIVLATCSGICNVGQLTTQAAMHLIRRRPGLFRWMKVEKGKPVKAVLPTDTVWAIVGCEDKCACRELRRSGVTYEKTVIATQLGIVRDIRADVRFDEIEQFARLIIHENSETSCQQ